MDVKTEFAPDCEACVALCCMALSFDAGDSFAHDKAAGVGCHHLRGFSCGIHRMLTDRGYGGCVRFDCLGAGQKVSALFDDHWRDDPTLVVPMMAAFRQMREVQELRQMLVTAKGLDLPEDAEGEREIWLARLTEAAQSTETLAKADVVAARHWLRGLSAHIRRAG